MEFLRKLELEHVHTLSDHEFRTLFANNVRQVSEFLELESADLHEMGLDKESRRNISRLIKAENDKVMRRQHFEITKENALLKQQTESQARLLQTLTQELQALRQIVSGGGGGNGQQQLSVASALLVGDEQVSTSENERTVGGDGNTNDSASSFSRISSQHLEDCVENVES